MTTEILVFGVGMMIAVIVLLWVLIWHFVTKYSKKFQPVSPADMSKKALRRQQLNTEVVLTEDEKRAMKKGNWKAGIIVGVILSLIVSITAWNYWRFVVKGEPVQATITSVSKHRSSGRHHRTTYTYTLKADVDGATVTDSYSAGSSGGYTVGEVVDAYADTSGAHTDLAIASVVKASPFTTGGLALVVGFAVGSAIYAQGKRIQSGRAKIANLPARFRTARIANLPAISSVPPLPAPTTPDGLPMYTIGGSRELPKDDFPKDS